jgi:hypothetical protein
VAYGTLAASKIYHAARGNTAWAAADDADLEIALLRGSEYVDFTFRDQFPGTKTGLRNQVREWPREWAFDTDGESIGPTVIPIEVENGTYEAALRELTAPGSLMPDVTLGKQITEASVDGAVSVKYGGPSGLQGMRPTVSVVGAILAPVLTGSSARSAIVGQAVRA